MEFEKTLT